MPDEKLYTAILASPVGYLGVQLEGKMLFELEFLGKHMTAGQTESRAILPDDASKDVQSALNDYFNDPHSVEQPGTVLRGTAFQKKVWQILSSIKPGQTRTYGDIARQLDTSPRAVGNACRRNPVPIFIPCHRVVSASGRGGFMGHTSGEALEIKEWLLAHEQKITTA
jgi:methylated-DNA-[protein]-cysteine S-methyltransferase